MKISKKDIFIDFDGTTTNSVKAIVDLYNEDFKYYKCFKPINWYEINTWDFTELNCATPEYINVYFNQQRFFDRLEFMENAKEVLDRLKDYFNIIIVSLGYSPNLRIKKLWCENNLPYAKFIGVNFKEYPDKAHIPMSEGIAFIDDSSNNLKTSNCPNSILYGDTFSWNEDWNGLRKWNWYELEKYLMELEGEFTT